MLTIKAKQKIVKKYQLHEKDTGSAEIQAAIIHEEIEQLVDHLKRHPKDFHSKRGLLKMVARRKKILEWLKKEDEKRYNSLIKALGLKR